MPPHSSHLLQPLNVGCFGRLKRPYGDDVTRLARNAITRISKIDFLQAFKTAYIKALTPANIRASFKGAGLVPFNPDTVLAKLEVHLHMPTPPSTPIAESAWQSQTPHNTLEFESQYKLVRSQLQDTSPSCTESLDKLAKGAQLMIHSAVLIRDQVSSLQRTLQEQQRRKSYKRRYIQKEGHLNIAEARELAQEASIEEERPTQA